jgi:Calcineurin-like phosphoesterase
MYSTENLSISGVPPLPHADLALNTGDNVYTNGAEGSYRDYWMPVWNSDTDSNETGAPFVRSIPFFIVLGNHDTGATGVNVNMLGGDGGGRFTGNTDGGDAMAYFNNYYFPLNGPAGVDQEFTWTGDSVADNGSSSASRASRTHRPPRFKLTVIRRRWIRETARSGKSIR